MECSIDDIFGGCAIAYTLPWMGMAHWRWASLFKGSSLVGTSGRGEGEGEGEGGGGGGGGIQFEIVIIVDKWT